MNELAAGNRIVCDGEACTVRELRDRGAQRYSRWRGRRIALNTDSHANEVAAVLAARTIGFELAIMPSSRFSREWRERLSPVVHTLARDACGSIREWSGGAATPATSSGMWLFTSGTSGDPKPVRYAFDALNTFGGIQPTSHRWLMTYLSGTYAWIQLVMLCLHVSGQTLVFPRSLDADEALGAMDEHRVTAVSSTPTFWRYLMLTVGRDRLRTLSIGQVTLGGEHADQELLDELNDMFPQAAIAHTYASTEAGFAFSVKDGRAGFPLSLVGPVLGSGARLRIQDSTLWIRSPFSSAGDGEWVDTGDTVEVTGDRVHIRGRTSRDVINVGGVKVRIDDVESVIRGFEGVEWVRVYAIAAPIVGSLAAVDIVVDEKVWPDAAVAESTLIQRCERTLGAGHAPRIVTFLKEIPLTAALKSPRV